MSIAYESEPQHEVIDINAERSRLRTELNINPETVVTLPVSYEVATPISQDEIESFRAKDAEVAERHEMTRADLADVDKNIVRIHERDVAEVAKSVSDAEAQNEKLKLARDLEYQRRIRAAEEIKYRDTQNDAFKLAIKKSVNDNKLHASEKFMQVTELAVHQTAAAVEGGATVRQQHIERRESLIFSINELIARFNDRANHVAQAESRIAALDISLTEDEDEKEHLFRVGKRLRAKDTKIRTQMAESDPRMRELRASMDLNEENEYVKEVFSNIRDEQSSEELDRIKGDLEDNADAISAVRRSIEANQRSREADEVIIENATAELRVLATKLAERKKDYAYEVEVVAPQLEKQSEAVLNRTVLLKTMIGGNTTQLATKDSYKVLEPVVEAMHEHRAALTMESEKHVPETNRPTVYLPDEPLPFVESLEVQSELESAEERYKTSDGISETLSAIASADILGSARDRVIDVADIAKNGFMKTGRLMRFIKPEPTEK